MHSKSIISDKKSGSGEVFSQSGSSERMAHFKTLKFSAYEGATGAN